MNFLAPLYVAGLLAVAFAAPEDASKKVDALVHKYVHDNGPGMAVLVMKDGKVVHSKGYGLADIKKQVPIAPDTNFELASVSKQFTAMAIMLLNDEGKLSFDDDVRKHLPDLPVYDKKRPIRIRDLLNHTSGLPDYDYPDELTTNAAVYKSFLKSKEPLAYRTGTKHEYNNFGYVILAQVVKVASGKSYNDYLQAKLFGPLGMTHTVAYESAKVSRKQHARGYELRDGISEFKEKDSPASVLKRTKAENFKEAVVDCFIVGDGGVWSNLDDLARWDEAVRKKELVKARTWQEALTPVRLSSGKSEGYGFGWGLTTEGKNVIEVWHEGGGPGFSTLNSVDFQASFSVAILSNIDGFEHLSAIYDGILEIYVK